MNHEFMTRKSIIPHLEKNKLQTQNTRPYAQINEKYVEI